LRLRILSDVYSSSKDWVLCLRSLDGELNGLLESVEFIKDWTEDNKVWFSAIVFN